MDSPNQLPKSLTIKEREGLSKLVTGKISPDSATGQALLNRPHVAVAFEAILDKHNLTDEKLVGRLAEIIRRKATESENKTTGTKATNIAAIDSNAREVIKLIWQVQGRFVEKHELKGTLSRVEDEELDKIIAHGTAFLQNKGKNRLDGSVLGSTG